MIRISGTATEVCPPENYGPGYVAPDENSIHIGSDTKFCEVNQDGDEECHFGGSCDLSDLPAHFSAEIPVAAGEWEKLDPSLPVNIQLIVETGLQQINSSPPTFSSTTAIWEREVDLLRGTHTIPPRLGAGYWISVDHPNEGLLIQQQGDRLVAYEMAYGEELTMEGNHVGEWIYTDATFAGDSTNGLSVKIARPDLESPEVVFEQTLSSSFIVDDVNHVRAMFDARPVEADETEDLFYKSYRRWVFNQDQQPFPVTVPDFSGEWTLLRFDGATELERDAVVLGEGAWLDSNRWRFMAVDGSASLICKVTITTGLGHCIYQADDGAEKLRFEIADFNGNIGQGAWLNAGDQPVSDGIFLRAPYELP